ncbi:alpha amylase [Abortiporus biennis]|nr:alpha amylase [Abortiporus biennis]
MTSENTVQFVPTKAWWKSAVVYQIYPISFFDSNGDGIGDLNGIHAKLDYLKDLGVDVLWLSPIYDSPLVDMGYDISDYCSIDPRFGTLGDWDKLIEGVHQRGMKLLMDLVVNHTSDQHAWFIESRSNKENPKRDWYIWGKPKFDAEGNRRPPNNWKSIFQGSAWEYDDHTGEYYLHLYAPEQPDLNWTNNAVRDAVWDTMRFWLDRGCDGFRMDTINHISKVEGYPDAPIVDSTSIYQSGSMHYINGPQVHKYIQEMHKRVLSHYDIMTVGETPFSNEPEAVAPYVLPQNEELQMVFQFELVKIDASNPEGTTSEGNDADSDPLIYKPWKLKDLKSIITKWQQLKREDGFWNAIYIENHDNARSVSRFGNDSPQWRAISAKLLAILQITQSGTLYVYQGEEIGMKNFPIEWGIEEYKDLATINFWNQALEERRKREGKLDVDMSDILKNCQRKARDHARTPMQWHRGLHAGFTTGKPWMRVNEEDNSWNVADEETDPSSVLSFWKKALRVRKSHDVLTYGSFQLVDPTNDKIFAYTRYLEGLSPVKALILLNFGTEEAVLSDYINVTDLKGAKLVLSNYVDGAPDVWTGERAALRGYEGRVYVLE